MSASSKKPRRESAILAARDPSITNSDDWPEFSLANATVTLPTTAASTTSEPTSLLRASEHHPLTLTGQLDPPTKDQIHLWISRPTPRTPLTIQVSDVVSYSYGAYEDGSIELWAAGKAGWFRLRPSARYKPVYEEMLEAVRILFFIVDAYSTPRKSGKGKNAVVLPDFTAQELFEKYAVEVLGVVKGAPEAANKIYKHREFLLGSMIEGKEGLAWGKNPLYMHLCRKFAGDAKRIRARKAEVKEALAKGKEMDKGKAAKVAAPPHARQASLDSISTTSSLKRKRGRPAKGADATSIASSELPDDASETKATSQTKARPKPKITRNTRSNPAQSTTPEIPESQPTTPAAGYDSDSEVPNARRKSALRLKPNKATKGPPKKSSRLALAVEDEDDDEQDAEHQSDSIPEPPTRQNGNKRKRDGTSSRSVNPPKELPTRPSKPTTNTSTRGGRTRNRSKQDSTHASKIVDEGIEIPTSPSAASAASSPASDDAVAGAPDPLQENVWTCALDGCTHKIYGYDPSAGANNANPEVQRLIREHYTLHAYDDDERVRLVKGMAEPSLPVNYLVERVRGLVRAEGLGKVVGGGLEAVGTRFPEPLRTKV